MSVPSEHPHDDLAVYALDALGPAERDEVEDHVRRCPACRAELDGYRQTLAMVVGDEPPPAGAWDAIARAVAASNNGHGGDAPIPRVAPTAPAHLAAGGRRSGRSARPVRSVRRRAAALLASAAAIVLVVAAVGVGWGRAVERPDAAVADLVAPDGEVVARVVVDGEDGYALVEGLPPLPEGRGYQLWQVEGDRTTSLGMVGDGRAEAVAVAPAPEASGEPGASGTRLALSEEPAGGVDAPTGPIVATGAFS